MRRALSIVAASVVLIALAIGPSPASPVYTWDFHAGTKTAGTGDEVAITLFNDGTRSITMSNVWEIRSLDGGGSSQYYWPEDQLEIGAGEVVTWFWDQHVNACYGACQNVREGDPAPVGRYVATAAVEGEEVTTRFSVGQFFTLGFRERSAEFSVFVSTQKEIDQMSAEAAADEKTLIVSGIVKKQVPYNSRWNFSMGHRTIELGEVFIEVCDGSPRYVHRHRDEWLGDRWCPWSSYVKRVGI
jgi:hypothetical protein